MDKIMKRIICFFFGHKIVYGWFFDTEGLYLYKKKCSRCNVHFGLPDLTQKWMDLYAPIPQDKKKVGITAKEATEKFAAIGLAIKNELEKENEWFLKKSLEVWDSIPKSESQKDSHPPPTSFENP